MTDPLNFTVAQAKDPKTPGQTLADIAALRPDLRAIVAGNPSAYPDLLEWLGSLGQPAVDAVLAARGCRPPPRPDSCAVTSGCGRPDGGGVGYGPASAGSPYAPDLVGPGYGPQGGGPGYGFGAQGSRKSNTTVWIVVGVVLAVAVLGVVAWLVVSKMNDKAGRYGSDAALDTLYDACKGGDWQACDDLYEKADAGTDYKKFGDTCGGKGASGTLSVCVDVFGSDPSTDPSTEPSTEPSTGPEPTADPDVLREACAAHDMQACDDLDSVAESGSEYASFADTCGGTLPAYSGGLCEYISDSPFTRGDDPALDALWDACAAGNGGECEELYHEAVYNTDYWRFGDTCGGTQPDFGGDFCRLLAGDYSAINDSPTYGQDPALDPEWDACAGGDMAGCRSLYWDAPIYSGYWYFAVSCGNRGVVEPGTCELSTG